DDSALATLMAQALQETGSLAEARKYWEAVRRGEVASERLDVLIAQVRKRPSDLALRYEIGTMLIRYRAREEGAGWLRSLLQYDPGHVAAHRALADYYSKIGETELAEQHRRFSSAPEDGRGS